MSVFKKFILAVSILGMVFGFTSVQAQGIKDQSMLTSIAGKAGVADTGNVESLSGTIIKAILSITGLIFLILMVYAGMLWMTARGDEGQVDKSKEIIQAAIIGLAVTVSAYAITVFVTSRFSSEGPSVYCLAIDAAENKECIPAPSGTQDCSAFAVTKSFVSGSGPYNTDASCKLNL